MPGNPHERRNIQHIAEGRAEQVAHDRALYSDSGRVISSNFYKAVVLEVIHDPMMIDKVKLSHYEHDLGVSNIEYAAVAPRNSIIARKVMGAGTGAADQILVLYPFFPSHIAMPAKPGEHVWVMLEHPNAEITEIGYWMCRVSGPSFVEDVNYSHMDRQFDHSFLPGLSDVFEGSDEPVYEFRNGAVDNANGQRYVIPETSSVPAGDSVDAYPALLTKTDASQLVDYEPVPRFRKRPADMALEGSNNTLIVLGTDRTGAASDYTSDPNMGQIPKRVADDTANGQAGAIDLVAGRGQTPTTGGTSVTNAAPISKKELAKHAKALAAKEGDVDFANDRSRILIAQKTKPDTNFKIDTVISAHSSTAAVTDGDGEGSIVVKTDKIRFVARQDLVILVSGDTVDPSSGEPAADPSKCCTIIMRTNGDIVFTPSSTGLVRLGGDGANLSPLCSEVGPSAGQAGPVAPPAPIIDTMGGSQGAAGGLNGTFPKKVLML